MKTKALLLLRVSLGFLLVIWGADKLINVDHGLKVSEHFYGNLVSAPSLMTAFGVFEIILGLAIVAGLGRRYAYPALLIVTGVTLVAVWKSIIDPFGKLFEGGQILFYPSSIIFAGAFVLLAFRDEDKLSLDRRLGALR
ncbi:MAG: DoxX family protein [Anaerolineae bacterium]|nr:DoxX family protein [Gemmatimonadaceae bacterium]